MVCNTIARERSTIARGIWLGNLARPIVPGKGFVLFLALCDL